MVNQDYILLLKYFQIAWFNVQKTMICALELTVWSLVQKLLNEKVYRMHACNILYTIYRTSSKNSA